MRRARLKPALRRIDCFQLAEALEVTPATIIGFFYGASHPGVRLPAKIECRIGKGQKNVTRVDAYMWFTETDIIAFLNRAHPDLLPTWWKNAKMVRQTPVRPLPHGVKMYEELRKKGEIDEARKTQSAS